MEHTSLRDFVEQLDQDIINDIHNYGCVNGCVSELIYYSDTNKFYDAYAEEIHTIVDRYIRDTGEMPKHLIESIGSLVNFKNDMVWFAVELLSEEFVNEEA
jgi:hypothetical protein